jgi:hypothetical protein
MHADNNLKLTGVFCYCYDARKVADLTFGVRRCFLENQMQSCCAVGTCSYIVFASDELEYLPAESVIISDLFCHFPSPEFLC